MLTLNNLDSKKIKKVQLDLFSPIKIKSDAEVDSNMDLDSASDKISYIEDKKLKKYKKIVSISSTQPGEILLTSIVDREARKNGNFFINNNDEKKPNYEKNEDFESQIKLEKEFSGPFLKRVREYKNMSIEYVTKKTKIAINHIKNIEEENYNYLPSKIYVIGFMKIYSKILGLNQDLVSSKYIERYEKHRKKDL